MVTFFDEYVDYLEGGYFSTFRKNLGNKLFIYGIARLVSDKLNCNLILPENPLIRRELFHLGYQNDRFPFYSITDRQTFSGKTKTLDDSDLKHYGNLDNFLTDYHNVPIQIIGYYSKYEYVRLYRTELKEIYNNIIKPKRNNNDLVIMLRDSTQDARFILPDEYYIDILEKETFDTLYVSFDHCYKHNSLFQKLRKYNPIYLESNIITLFKEITSFNKIIASQGTFSFWACFLSDANVIYWPLTEDGPNSNNENFVDGVDLLVNDDDRYKIINLKS